MMIEKAIGKLVENIHLTSDEAESVMDQIMNGDATEAQIGAYLVALRMLGESPDEIIGSVRSMRSKSTKIKSRHSEIVDVVGTGGDGTHTFNISTTSALVVSATGQPVAKHGNRSVSSSSGAADVLKELGVNIEIPPEKVGRCLDEVGIAFLFAPLLHGAMKHAIGPRRELSMRSIFNVMGPLTNPANADTLLVGVYSEMLTELIADVLSKLGCKRALVVHGLDGMDEITLCASTKVSEWNGEEVRTYEISPEDFGFQKVKSKELLGGKPKENAEITRRILNGEKGAKRDVVLMNVSAALLASGHVDNLLDGVNLAAEVIDNGKAIEKLDQLIEVTNS
tara:strand:- start:10572 stop:11585 length:1014 start_codon:yes stop_codon:yes gene_type:complete